MGANSKIEWCDHTFNPWLGCQRVSPGCDNCYAEQMLDRWLRRVQWGPHGERKRTSAAHWREPIKWNGKPMDHRPRVFCASLSDWLDNKVDPEWRADLARLIEATANLDWLLLTKRIENFAKLSPWSDAVPANVWLGVTAEDQKRYEQRWKTLGSLRARVRFVSYEPAIGPLRLDDDAPDWIICGGERARQPRRFNPDWARRLRDDCAARGVAFFLKQMAGRAEIPDDLMIREFPTASMERAL